MVKIRLRRMGAKKKPFYRIVAADSRTARNGRFLEILGTYDPTADPPEVKLNKERAQYWLDSGAQASDTARGILKVQGLLGGVTVKKQVEPKKKAAKEAEVVEVQEAKPVKEPKAKKAAEAKPKEEPVVEAAAEAVPVEKPAAETVSVEEPAATTEEPVVEAPVAEAAPVEEPAAEAPATEEAAEEKAE